MSEDNEKEGINLLVLWDTKPRYSLNNLYLVYPKHGGRTKESLDCFWSDKIPENYMFGIQPKIAFEAQEIQADLQMSFKPFTKQAEGGEDRND